MIKKTFVNIFCAFGLAACLLVVGCSRKKTDESSERPGAEAAMPTSPAPDVAPDQKLRSSFTKTGCFEFVDEQYGLLKIGKQSEDVLGVNFDAAPKFKGPHVVRVTGELWKRSDGEYLNSARVDAVLGTCKAWIAP